MEIRNFQGTIRCGSNWPAVIDVSKITGHESYGVMALAWTYRHKDETGFVQVRKHSELDMVALFTFKYDDESIIPDEWKDSTVIWDSRKENENDQG